MRNFHDLLRQNPTSLFILLGWCSISMASLTMQSMYWVLVARIEVPPKHQFTQDLHGATSQKTVFFITNIVYIQRTNDWEIWFSVRSCLCNASRFPQIGCYPKTDTPAVGLLPWSLWTGFVWQHFLQHWCSSSCCKFGVITSSLSTAYARERWGYQLSRKSYRICILHFIPLTLERMWWWLRNMKTILNMTCILVFNVLNTCSQLLSVWKNIKPG
jgi:hypothetical protein